MHSIEGSKTEPKLSLRKPNREDGAGIWTLIAACRPLDENSMYCNLIQCDHFRDTCVVAELDGEIVGWVSAYLMPDDPETMFVWQVAVSEKARGRGLGARMLDHIIARDTCGEVTRIQTTITIDNDASWALFGRFGKARGARLRTQPYFIREDHFDGHHATEHMLTIDFASELERAA